jgi:hypothetical protein
MWHLQKFLQCIRVEFTPSISLNFLCMYLSSIPILFFSSFLNLFETKLIVYPSPPLS